MRAAFKVVLYEGRCSDYMMGTWKLPTSTEHLLCMSPKPSWNKSLKKERLSRRPVFFPELTSYHRQPGHLARYNLGEGLSFAFRNGSWILPILNWKFKRQSTRHQQPNHAPGGPSRCLGKSFPTPRISQISRISHIWPHQQVCLLLAIKG